MDDIPNLDELLQEIRGEDSTQKSSSKKKISAEKFLNKTPKVKVKQKKIKKIRDSSKLTDEVIKKSKENKQYDSEVYTSLKKIEDNLAGILDIFSNQLELEKKESEAIRKASEISEQKLEEKSLEESSSSGNRFKKISSTIIKPAMGLLDIIGNFLTNFLVGGALIALLDFIKDPKKILNPIFEFINGMIDNIENGIQSIVNIPYDIANTLITSFNDGTKFIVDAINNVLSFLKQDTLDPPTPVEPMIPPVIELPRIPIEYPAQPTAGFAEGGSITNNTGTPITGMGNDTQLIAAQPGEFVMSKGAVSLLGADTLASLNSMGGGTNNPKMGKFSAFQNGGMIRPAEGKALGYQSGGLVGGKVVIGAGHAPSPYNAARGIPIGSDGRHVQGTQDYNTGVPEWKATRHLVNTLKKLVNERGLTDKVEFRDIYSYQGLTAVPREVERIRGNQYLDIHFDARGFGKAGVLPAANESSMDASLMREFGRYSDSFDPNSKGVTRAGGTLLEIARIDDPKIRGFLDEVKSGEHGPETIKMAERVLRGINVLPTTKIQPPAPPSAPSIQPVVIPAGSTTKSSSGGSSSSADQKVVPVFSAIDEDNPEIFVIKSIYNIVG